MEERELTAFADELNVKNKEKRISHDTWVIWHLYLLSTAFIPETESSVALKKIHWQSSPFFYPSIYGVSIYI